MNRAKAWMGGLIAGSLALSAALFALGSVWRLQQAISFEDSSGGDIREHMASFDEDASQSDELRGLWSRFEGRADAQPLRFYYFHGDGTGLYRYGKVGWTQTHSFDYRVEKNALELLFRKRGERHRSKFVIARDDRGRATLTLADDPRDPGATYVLEAPPISEAAPSAKPQHPGGRLWINFRNFAAGGYEFSMYQLNAPAIDGRGVGWFHRGDFDDWTTEALQFRVNGDELELFFDLQERFETTGFSLSVGADDERRLTLRSDPRNFWIASEFVDAGPSFGGHPAFARIRNVQQLWTHAQADDSAPGLELRGNSSRTVQRAAPPTRADSPRPGAVLE